MDDDPFISGGVMLLLCFGMTVFMQCSFFLVAYTCQFDTVTDLAGSLNFLVLALVSFLVQNVFTTRAIILTCMQVTWALRLGAFLLLRVLERGKDERFNQMRAHCMAFFGFWVFQIVWVFVVSLPVVLANACGDQVDGEFGEARDIIGLIVWAVGMLVEYAADSSKSKFQKDLKNKGKLLRSGVWKYSRHPNYFGEILCWVGVTIVASANFGGKGGQTWFYYVSWLSPALTFLLLMFVSGVPLAEDRYDERFGLETDYIEYKHSTSPLILLPPSIYRSIPSPIKRWCLFELKRYSRKLQELRNAERKAPRADYQAIS